MKSKKYREGSALSPVIEGPTTTAAATYYMNTFKKIREIYFKEYEKYILKIREIHTAKSRK